MPHKGQAPERQRAREDVQARREGKRTKKQQDVKDLFARKAQSNEEERSKKERKKQSPSIQKRRRKYRETEMKKNRESVLLTVEKHEEIRVAPEESLLRRFPHSLQNTTRRKEEW